MARSGAGFPSPARSMEQTCTMSYSYFGRALFAKPRFRRKRMSPRRFARRQRATSETLARLGTVGLL